MGETRIIMGNIYFRPSVTNSKNAVKKRIIRGEQELPYQTLLTKNRKIPRILPT